MKKYIESMKKYVRNMKAFSPAIRKREVGKGRGKGPKKYIKNYKKICDRRIYAGSKTLKNFKNFPLHRS